MLHFHKTTLINAPVDIVWQFHCRPDVLELLTPPWQPMQVIRREGGLEIGAETEFRLWLGPVPLRWVSRHTEYEPYRLFTDEQVVGPLAHWQHRHQFEPAWDKTRLTDAIAFSLPLGFLADPLLGWWVQGQLANLFRYRHAVTQRECALTK
jgi:ligand-binding SRPBCC domain-containing protein